MKNIQQRLLIPKRQPPKVQDAGTAGTEPQLVNTSSRTGLQPQGDTLVPLRNAPKKQALLEAMRYWALSR